MNKNLKIILGLLAGLLGVSQVQAAANCSNLIQSIPTSIDSPGYYCLNANLSSSLKSGHMIRVNASDVVIDLQGHSIENGPNSEDTSAFAISSDQQSRITVKNGTIKGFMIGITHSGVSNNKGHVIKDMRFVSIRHAALSIDGQGHQFKNLKINNTGVGNKGGNLSRNVFAIQLLGNSHVLENVSVSIVANPGNRSSYGIHSSALFTVFDDVHIESVIANGAGDTGLKYGIFLTAGTRSVIKNSSVRNTLAAETAHAIPIRCATESSGMVRDTFISKYSQGGVLGCKLGPGNVILP